MKARSLLALVAGRPARPTPPDRPPTPPTDACDAARGAGSGRPAGDAATRRRGAAAERRAAAALDPARRRGDDGLQRRAAEHPSRRATAGSSASPAARNPSSGFQAQRAGQRLQPPLDDLADAGRSCPLSTSSRSVSPSPVQPAALEPRRDAAAEPLAEPHRIAPGGGALQLARGCRARRSRDRADRGRRRNCRTGPGRASPGPARRSPPNCRAAPCRCRARRGNRDARPRRCRRAGRRRAGAARMRGSSSKAGRDPGVEQVAMLGEAAEPRPGLARRLDQRIERARFGRQLVVEQAFADAEAGDDQPLGIEHARPAPRAAALALGRVGKRESETEGMSRTLALSILAAPPRSSRGRSTAMSCWWVIGSGCSVSAMSSRASARQLPPTM